MVRMKDKQESILVKRLIGTWLMGRLLLAGSLFSPHSAFENATIF